MKRTLLATSLIILFGAQTAHAETTVESELRKVRGEITLLSAQIAKDSEKKAFETPLLPIIQLNIDEIEENKAKHADLVLYESNLANRLLADKAVEITNHSKTLLEQKKAKIKELEEIEAQAKLEREQGAKKAEEKAQAERERQAKETLEEESKTKEEPQTTPREQPQPESSGGLEFGADGLLVMTQSSAAQNVINLELGIPGHANGASYHQTTGLDAAIDALTVPEAVYAVYRMEGAGFGQTGDGWAGVDSPESHNAFVQNQVNRRFGGDIKLLLKMWGTYSYGSY